jgi:hypothetical protein
VAGDDYSSEEWTPAGNQATTCKRYWRHVR